MGQTRPEFLIAPAIVATTAFLMFSVVPFGGDITLWGRKIPLVVTDLNIERFSFSPCRPLVSTEWPWAAGHRDFEVRSSRRHTRCGPDDQLRTLHGAFAHPCGHDGALVQRGRYCRVAAKISVYHFSTPGFPHFPHKRDGGEQENSVRSARGRKRTDCGIPYRIQRHALRPFFSLANTFT